jgi:hypothetical protein
MAERVTAAQADLEWRANTGRVEADVASLRREFHAATEAMGDDALRLAVAQDKLDRALVRHGPASTQAKQAELAYRRELQSSTAAARRYDTELDRNTRSLERFSRGALAGSGALRGLRGAVAFASAGFLGGAGLIYGIRSAIDAASGLEEATNKNQVVFRDSAGEILDWSRTTSTALGLAQAEALQAAGGFGAMLVPMGLSRAAAADMARELVRLAADMASFNDEDPSAMLERIRSGIAGEVEPLRRFGAILSESRVKQFAWANGIAAAGAELTDQQKILARYGLLLRDTADQQGDYARTADSSANAERSLHAVWRDTQALLGQALLPAYGDVVRGLRDWLAEDRNRLELQRNVNTLVRDGTQVVRGLARGLEAVAAVGGPVVDALGGIDNAVELALVAGLIAKARRAALSLGLIATASAATRTKVVADAAAMGAALDAATRPRVVPIAVTGGAVGGAAGRGGALGRLGGPVGIIGTTLAIVFGPELANQILNEQALSPADYEKLRQAARDGRLTIEEIEGLPGWVLTGDQRKELLRLARAARSEARERAGSHVSPDTLDPRRPGGTADTRRRGRGGPRARGELDIEIDLARARTTPGTGDELGFLRELRTFQQRQIDALERRRRLTDEQKEKLRQLYAAIASTQSQIDSIIETNERAGEERRKRIEDRRRERLDEREQALENRRSEAGLTESDADDRRALQALIEFYRRQTRNDDLTLKERRQYEAKRAATRRELRQLDADRRRERIDAKEERLKNAVEAAELTETLTDDRRQLQRLMAYYRQLARNDELAAKERREYVQRRIAAEQALQKLGASTTSSSTRSFEQLAFGFLQTLQGITNQFRSNVSTDGRPGTGGPVNVTVNQTFPEPTPDKNTEALYMRHAVDRAFQAA